MANAYPSAGSAYAYVSREIHPAPGYLVGWGMIFDYVMNPIICVIWCSEATVDLGILPGFLRRLVRGLRAAVHRAEPCGASRPAAAPTPSSPPAWGWSSCCSSVRAVRHLLADTRRRTRRRLEPAFL